MIILLVVVMERLILFRYPNLYVRWQMWTTLLQADNINRKEEKATTTIIKQK